METETERQVVKTPFLPSSEKAESELTPFGAWVPPARQFTKEDGVPPFPAPLPFFTPDGQRREELHGGRLYYNCGNKKINFNIRNLVNDPDSAPKDLGSGLADHREKR